MTAAQIFGIALGAIVLAVIAITLVSMAVQDYRTLQKRMETHEQRMGRIDQALKDADKIRRWGRERRYE